jgi:hypothetical protein
VSDPAGGGEPRDEVARLRAANTRLRQVVEAKDTEIGGLRAALAGLQGQFAAELVALKEELAGNAERLAVLEAELARLRAQAGKDSTNSSTPPSQDSIGAKAKRRAERSKDLSQRERSAGRKPGGQPGREGSGLAPTRDPDRSERAVAAVACPCGQGLSDVDDVGSAWAQVWDIPPVELEKVHWVLPRRCCGSCGKTSTAVVAFASPGAVVYGPNVNAAAVLLASQGNVPVERAAGLMAALLGAPVSAGFVASPSFRDKWILPA